MTSPSTPTDARAEKRAALLDAAERALGGRGHAELRVETIAREANVAKGTIYLYFSSKDALFAAIAERHTSRAAPPLRELAEGAPSGLAGAGRILAEHARAFVRMPERLRFLIRWLMADSLDDDSEDFAAYQAALTSLIEIGIATLARGQKDGSVDPTLDPVHHALQLWHASLGVLLFETHADNFAKRSTIPHDLRRVRVAHIHTQLRGLAATPAAAERAIDYAPALLALPLDASPDALDVSAPSASPRATAPVARDTAPHTHDDAA